MLEILVMCGDYTPHVAVVELAQYGLGDGTAYLRLCSASEFVNQNEGRCVAALEEILHVAEVRAVG